MSFIETVKAKAKANPKTVVLPESYDERMLFAAEQINKEGLAKLTILGNPDKVKADADAKSVDLTGVTILDPAVAPKLDAYVDKLVEIRKAKGLTQADARKILTAPDHLFFAGMMVRERDIDGCVAGATSTTGNVLRAGIQTVGTAPGFKTVSSFFVMITKNAKFGDNGIIFFADCGVSPNPDAQALGEIAVATARNYKALIGEDARVAMLSFSTKGSASHPDVDKVINHPQHRGKEGPREPGGGQGQCPHIPRSRLRQHRLQTHREDRWGRGLRPPHPRDGQACKRPLPGLLGGRYRQRSGNNGS